MGTRPVQFIDADIDYDIRLDIVHIRFGEHGTWAIPLCVCERAHERLGRTMRDYRSKQAEIVRLKYGSGAA